MTDARSEARQRHAAHLRSKASVLAREEAKAEAAKKPAKQDATVKPKPDKK